MIDKLEKCDMNSVCQYTKLCNKFLNENDLVLDLKDCSYYGFLCRTHITMLIKGAYDVK